MASLATVRVEKATSDLLLGPDWTMNMAICDSINTDPGLAKDVVKVVKKRLQHKSPGVQLLALTLLETMIKNCGDFVHSQVVERDILQDMVKIVRKKADMEVREKILVLLDSWQEAFGGPSGKYPQFFLAYSDLKRSGVDFPQRSGDASLIFTPPMQHPTPPMHPQVGYGMPSNSAIRLDVAMASDLENLSLSDLERIRSVMELLNEILKAVNPHDREAAKDELIIDLVDQCRSNLKKILHLIDSTGDEKLLAQGLALNDNLQSLLAKHDAIATGNPPTDEASESVLVPNGTAALVAGVVPADFVDDEEEEDDEFAQLARRNVKSKLTDQRRSVETSDQAMPLTTGNVRTASVGSTCNVASLVEGNALFLPDPPRPVRTSTEKQNLTDLLSITLSSNTSPHTPISPSIATFRQYNSPELIATSGQSYPQNPQIYTLNQDYLPYSSYVTPWAQALQPSSTQSQQHPPQLLPQHEQHHRPDQQPQPHLPPYQQPRLLHHSQPHVVEHASYPPPPWEDSPSANISNPFIQANYRFLTSSVNPASGELPASSLMSVGQFNSLAVEAAKPPASTWEPRPSANFYVPSYKLFEDLIDLRSPNGALKAGSSVGEGMVHDRK